MWHEKTLPPACLLTVIFPLLLLNTVLADIGLCIIAALFLAHSWQAKKWVWLKERWVQLFVLLWLCMIVRGLFAPSPRDALARAVPFIRYIIFAAALARWTLADDTTRRRFFNVLTITVVALACDGLLQYDTGFDLLRRLFIFDPAGDNIRLTGAFSKPILGIMLAWLAFPALLPLMFSRKSLTLRLACLCAVLVAIAFSGERIALLLTLMGTVLAGFLLRLKPRLMLGSLTAIVVLLGVLAFASPMLMKRQFESTFTTLTHWKKSPYGMLLASDLAVASEHPVIGVGASHFRAACEALYPNDKKRIADRCNTHPHNIYLEWLIEEGLIGLALFAGVIVTVFQDCIRVFARERGNPAFTGLIIALVLRVWPFMSTTNFFSRWGAPPFWLVLGALLVYTRRVSNAGVKNAGTSLPLQDSGF